MQNLIPEHPASHGATLIVIAAILLSLFFMALVW